MTYIYDSIAKKNIKVYDLSSDDDEDKRLIDDDQTIAHKSVLISFKKRLAVVNRINQIKKESMAGKKAKKVPDCIKNKLLNKMAKFHHELNLKASYVNNLKRKITEAKEIPKKATCKNQEHIDDVRM